MTINLVAFLFLMFFAFSMKRKRTDKYAQIREPNARRTSAHSTPLLGKNTWNIVHSFLLPQSETKFNEIHQKFCQFLTKYERRLFRSNMNANWHFFTHFETDKMFAENVTGTNRFGCTALHSAAYMNHVEIAKAVIEAGVDIDAKDNFGRTALHSAALWNRVEIGKVLIKAGADLNIKGDIKWRNKKRTALELAVGQNHVAFVEMLRKNMK